VTTVLVVEDERDIRDVLRRYLERADMSVLTTGTGAEAMRLLTSSDLDVVILDLGLPDIDGLEVLREARRLGGLRVLVLTARSQVDDRITGLELGADDYVTKPFSPREIVLRVQAIAGRATTSTPTQDHRFGSGRLMRRTRAGCCPGWWRASVATGTAWVCRRSVARSSSTRPMPAIRW
jgi:DNA-binding response OmpR family regulator